MELYIGRIHRNKMETYNKLPKDIADIRILAVKEDGSCCYIGLEALKELMNKGKNK